MGVVLGNKNNIKLNKRERQELHERALRAFVEERTINATAKRVGASTVSVKKWAEAGYPHTITHGLPWIDYVKELDRKTIQKSAAANRTHKEFLDNSRKLVEDTIDQIGLKLRAGEFEAKPEQLDKLMRLHTMLDQQDLEKKNWMDSMMVHVLTQIAEVVTTQQFAVIRTKLLNLNVEETDKLDIIDKSVPGLPIHPEEFKDAPQDVPYTLVENED